jgi:hypothetical protein
MSAANASPPSPNGISVIDGMEELDKTCLVETGHEPKNVDFPLFVSDCKVILCGMV